VHVVGAAELEPTPERLTEPQALVQRRGDCEAEQREPGETREHGRPDERREREEDDEPDGEGGDQSGTRRPLRRRDVARRDEGERDQGRERPQQERADEPVAVDRELVADCERQAERKREPEMPLVEADRLGDQLPDRPAVRGERRRHLFFALTSARHR
jgi:hypothetical protein